MKSPAPFMSINPSGSVGGVLTASRWKGRNYLRLLVTPSNPQTVAQSATRSLIGFFTKAATSVLTSFADTLGVGSLFFTSARDQAPSGQSWISNMTKKLFPAAADIATAWTALMSTKQGYFTTTAAAIGLIDYVPTYPGGVTYTKGKQLHALAFFASHYLTGDIKTAADLAIAGASQGDVDDFGDAVHLTS